jgi:hypothetical protein
VADRVVFLRPDAERIARAVRAVENGNRNETPLRFGRTVEGGRQKVFRIGTFSGAWNIGASKTVTFKYQTTTPNTVSATNLFFPVELTGTRDCAIAKDGTAWYLIDVPLKTSFGIIVTQTASQQFVSSISNLSGSLDSNCNVVVTMSVSTGTMVRIASSYTANILELQ